MDALRRQFEAITEAATFIRETWIGPTTLLWRGSVDDFQAAVIGAGVTRQDITSMLDALAAGEPLPIEGVSGVWNRAGELVEVVIYRPVEVACGS